jgi:cytochrome c peroxidase
MKTIFLFSRNAALTSLLILSLGRAEAQTSTELSRQLQSVLTQHQFTGRIESTLTKRLGRPLDAAKVELGRKLFFDKFFGLHGDNTCAGCHSPRHGLGDSQSIAIGVDNNDIVGALRAGPRNQRRTPSIINTAFYPKLMWNGRFSALSGDPFNNSKGYFFPDPEGTTRFPAGDVRFRHLLVAQAHIPPTELPEMAGFTGYKRTTVQVLPSSQPNPNDPTVIDFGIFDVPARNYSGVALPPPVVVQRAGPTVILDEFRNEPIRDVVLGRLNANESWSYEFLKAFKTMGGNDAITFDMVAQALAEFEFSLTFANAPVDRFARGETTCLTDAQKRGGLLFFGKANCVKCHAVSGQSNEMFSDFEMHVAAIPQIAPKFGKTTGNVPFRDANGAFSTLGNQDWGLYDVTGNIADAYKFRSSPLRNVATQPTFFHNGAFTRLEDAMRYHMNTVAASKTYSATAAGVAADLTRNTGPIAPALANLDPLLKTPVVLTTTEFNDLLSFVRDALLDDRARPEQLGRIIPAQVPSYLPLQRFDR